MTAYMKLTLPRSPEASGVGQIPGIGGFVVRVFAPKAHACSCRSSRWSAVAPDEAADLVKWSEALAAVGLFWWLYGNGVEDIRCRGRAGHGSHLFRYRYVSSL